MPSLHFSDFDDVVDESLIALKPISPAHRAKLMVVHRDQSPIQHQTFADLAEHLSAGDLVIVNHSRVLTARFFGQKASGGEISGLFLGEHREAGAHQPLSRAWLKGRVKAGDVLTLEGGLQVQVIQKHDKEAVLNISPKDFCAHLIEHGHMPIPPYIESARDQAKSMVSEAIDRADYQNPFAEVQSQQYSAAAPTASLHFDALVLSRLKEKGIAVHSVALHVSDATFAPIEVEVLKDHPMHAEWASVPSEVWRLIQETKAKGHRVVAVGTTVIRTLESAALRVSQNLSIDLFETNLFIRPPFRFQIVDALITNFHWPKSTLIVLVATFLESRSHSPEVLTHRWREIYALARSERYRFFSFGDGMLIL